MEKRSEKFGLIDHLVKSMEIVENVMDLKGVDKKVWVLNEMQANLPEYERYADLLSCLVDFIIAISKDEYQIDLNRIKEKCSCFGFL